MEETSENAAKFNYPLLIVTIILQAIVFYIPMNIIWRAGHRVIYSIKTYGFGGEAFFLFFLLGLPSVALWGTYWQAKRKQSKTAMVFSFGSGLIGVAVLVCFSVLLAAVSGIR